MIEMKKQLLMALLMLFTITASAQKSENSKSVKTPDENGYIVFEGDECPDFKIKMTDGREIQLSSLKGKVVMLQFTASWCGVCRKEMPFIESDIWQKHKDNPDFMLIAIDRDEPLETVLKFAETTKITYPIGLDPGADIFAKFAVHDAGITRNVLINREGKIIKRTRLFNQEEFASLVKAIDNELKKGSASE